MPVLGEKELPARPGSGDAASSAPAQHFGVEDQLFLNALSSTDPASVVAVNFSFTKAAQTRQSGALRPNAVKLDAKVAIAIWIKSRPFWNPWRSPVRARYYLSIARAADERMVCP
jgi:hypothetical protein